MKKFIFPLLVLLIAGGCAVINKQTPTPVESQPTTVTAESVLKLTPTPLFKLATLPPLILTPASSIQVGLTNDIVTQGNDVTLSVVASNALFYYWQVPNCPLFVGTNTYTITNIQPANQGFVTVFISSSPTVVQSGRTNRIPAVGSSAYISVGTTNILADCIPSGGQSVTLAWCPSKDTNVVSYAIYYGSGVTTNWTSSVYDTNYPCNPPLSEGTNWCRCYTNTVVIGNTNSAVVKGLCPGITYYFAVKAADSSGVQSDFSNEARYTTPLYATPTNVIVKLTSVGANLVQFSAKVCPDSRITIQAKQDLRSQWSVMATNLTPDIYGNFFYNHAATMPQRFFRLQLQ